MSLQGISYAKVNLALHVVGQLENGYHELNSLVVFTTFGDTVSIATNQELTLKIKGPFRELVPKSSDNLILKGLCLMEDQEQTNFSIRLDKQIPVFAGLGGGSANAATVIQLVNKMVNCPIPSNRQLCKIGADVPMCMNSKPCLVSGIGENLDRNIILPKLQMLLVNPNRKLETSRVFTSLKQKKNPKLAPIEKPFSQHELIAWLGNQRNDLENSAMELQPEIKSVLNLLEKTSGCLFCRMTGSGPTCFGIYDSKNEAKNAAKKIAEERPEWWVKATETMGS